MNDTTKILLGVGGVVLALGAVVGATTMLSKSSSVADALPSFTGDSEYYSRGGRRKRTRRHKSRK